MFDRKSDVVKYIKKNEIRMVDLFMTDLVGRLRHLTLPAARCDEDFLNEGFGFDASNYGFKTVEKSDMAVIPDIRTAFIDPFREVRTLVMFGEVWSVEGKEKRFVDDLRFIAKRCEEKVKSVIPGAEILLGPEYEFYLFSGADYSSGMCSSHYEIIPAGRENEEYESGIRPPSDRVLKSVSSYHIAPPTDIFADFRDEAVMLLEEMGVHVKYHHHEVGVFGQMEIETTFGGILEMADTTVKVKYVVRNLARRYGLKATFMPKPLVGQPGSGMHVHFKMKGPGNRWLFADPEGYSGLSDVALSFLGGILEHSAALSGLTNPSVNSYRRLSGGFEAPCSVVFAESNRSAAIRVPGYVKSLDDKRFEYRPPDATANPYLAFSALCLAGLDGLERKTDPTKLGYGPYDMNMYELPESIRKKIKMLPSSLDEALDALEKKGEFLVRSGVFTSGLLKTWIEKKRSDEITIVRERPHPLEFLLYFEL